MICNVPAQLLAEQLALAAYYRTIIPPIGGLFRSHRTIVAGIAEQIRRAR